MVITKLFTGHLVIFVWVALYSGSRGPGSRGPGSRGPGSSPCPACGIVLLRKILYCHSASLTRVNNWVPAAR